MRSERTHTRTSCRQVLRAGATLGAALGLAGCALSTSPYTETTERTFDPGGADELVVETGSGDVTLTAL